MSKEQVKKAAGKAGTTKKASSAKAAPTKQKGSAASKRANRNKGK